MDVKIEGLDITRIIQTALADSLIQKLDKVLPKVVEDMLTNKSRMGSDDVVTRAIRTAVEGEVQAQIEAHLIHRIADIRNMVSAALDEKINSQFVTDCVVGELERIKVTVHPSKKKTMSAKSLDLDEEMD